MITLLIRILRAVRIIPRTSSPREPVRSPYVRNGGANRQQSRMITSSDFFRQAKEVTLSLGERMATKAGLLEKMRGPQESAPFIGRFFGFYKMTYAAGAFLIAGLAFGGLSYTAEGALPGDFLYPVKINVNERVRDSLATTRPEAAAWQAEKAERRLTEAEKLAAVSPLNAEVNRTLSREFKKNIKNMESNINSMLAGKDIAYAHDLNVAFQTSLKAHAALLTGLNGNRPVAAAMKQAVGNTFYDYENAGSGTDDLLASVNDAVLQAEETHVSMESDAPVLKTSDYQNSELARVLKLVQDETTFLQNELRNNSSASAPVIAFAKHKLSCASLAQTKAKNAGTPGLGLSLAYTALNDLKEVNIALTTNRTTGNEVNNDPGAIAEEVEQERHDGTLLSTSVQLKMAKERINAVESDLEKEHDAGTSAILTVEEAVAGTREIIDAVNGQLDSGEVDEAFKNSGEALKQATLSRDKVNKVHQENKHKKNADMETDD